MERNAKSVNKLKTVQSAAAKKIVRCSSTTSNTVLRVELGMYPLQKNRDLSQSKCQYIVRDMPKKWLPAIVDRAVWEKVTRRAGIR